MIEYEKPNAEQVSKSLSTFEKEIEISVKEANSKNPRNYASGGISIVDTSKHLDNMNIMKMLMSDDTSELQEALDKL